MRVEATRNAGSDTWHLVVHVPGKPDMVCPNAPWSLVERTTALETRGVTSHPSTLATAFGWVATPFVMLLGNPWFWLACVAGGGWHAC